MKTYTYGKQTIANDDIEGVISTLKSDFLTQGPKVAEFEANLCQVTGAKYAVAVNNGTSALHLAMLALDVGPGDVGITSPITFVASANCLLYVGAGVQFADIDPSTVLIDPKKIEKRLMSKTKVLIPVHYAGQSCDMEAISAIAKKHNLFVVEDGSHAIGSTHNGYKVGSCHYSDLTTFSFHPVKTITTGEGGAVTTNNPALYAKLINLRTHGIIQKPNTAPWYYEMHSLGYNFRIPDVLASLGVTQLAKLSLFMKRRQDIVDTYKEAFAGDKRFHLIQDLDNNQTVYHLYPLILNLPALKLSRREIYDKLLQNGLKLQVHYIPVHLHPYYQKLGFKKGDYPHAEAYYESTLSLPLYPSLTKLDLEKIVATIDRIIH